MREQEGLRRLIAGDLPDVDAGTAGKKAAKCVAVSVPGARLAYGENNRKLMGPFTEASRQAGRRVKLSTLLQLNGVQGKLGAGTDAPGLWLTVERVVRGRYEWWDAGLQPMFHKARRRMWEGARTWDPGVW